MKNNYLSDVEIKESLNVKAKSIEGRFDVKKGNIDYTSQVLNVVNLKVSFKKKKVLKGINFKLYKGETLAIVGKNGAGKTVLMETITGLIQKGEGKVYFEGKNTNFHYGRQDFGMQFQESTVVKTLRIKDYVKFYKSIFPDVVTDERIEEVFDVFKINEFKNKKINKLSGGQKQRINLMLSVLSNPKIMILDEFITGLDVLSVADIITYVNNQKINNNSSMIIISHQPEEIQSLADRIIVLKDGMITKETTPDKVIEEFGSMTSFLISNL